MSVQPENVAQIFRLYIHLSKENRKVARELFDTIDEVATITPVSPKELEQPIIQPGYPSRYSSRRYSFCEAIDQGGHNLIRYRSTTACWRAEIGDVETTGYTGHANAIESFRDAGWGIAFGDPNHKQMGVRVIRPKKV